ncbi:MAG: alpha/beta hydrolase [Anaerolineae bacterium]|nr:alpha/beta hydrolase [Anaerolineae bacterium]
MTPHPFFTVQAQEAAVEGKYASVNGLNMYYEIHGSGQPLILLHGGLGGIVEYSQLLQPLAQTRQVIAVELQGHGHTADIDRPMSYEQLADDVAALITELGFENVDVMGFSLGGGVALQTAIRHPEVLNKLVLVSTTYKREDMYAEFRTGMEAMTAESAAAMVDTPIYQFYSSVAPKLEDWPTLIGKLGEMLSQDYDWSADVASIKTPTLIVVGDSDMLHPAHAVELFGLLGGGVPGDFVGLPQSQLAVLPATSHFSILYRADLLLPVVVPFLDAPSAQ